MENQEEVKQTNNAGGFAVASLVLGICALIFGAIPIFGFILGIVALVIAIIAMKKIHNEKRGMAIAGLVTSIIGFILSIFMTGLIFLGVLIFNAASSDAILDSSKLSSIEMQAFNTQFEVYEGDISYYKAKMLIQAVESSNETSEHYITLIGDEKVDSSTQSYEVKLDYDSNGYVNRVTIDKE